MRKHKCYVFADTFLDQIMFKLLHDHYQYVVHGSNFSVYASVYKFIAYE